MSNKLQKFCNLVTYLKKNKAELYGVIDDLCMQSELNLKGAPGITLVIPGDKADMQKIVKAAYGDDPEEAMQILKAHIIRAHLPTPASWMTNRSDLPNALSQKVEVSEADSKKVKLSNGSVLQKDPGFVPTKSRDNMSVWVITGGMIPTNGKPSNKKFGRSAKKDVSGGSVSGGNVSGGCKDRYSYSNKMINKYLSWLAMKKEEYTCPLLKASGSLLNYVKSTNESLYDNLCKIVDPCACITFFLLFEPYKKSNHVVPNDVFTAWYREGVSIHVKKALEDALAHGQKLCTTMNKRNLQTRSRDKLLSDSVNKIVLPKAIRACYKDNGGDDALARDEFRYIMRKRFAELEDEKNNAAMETHIKTIASMYTFNNPSKQLELSDADLFKTSIAPSELFYSGPVGFVRSTDFMYTPITKDVAVKDGGITSIDESESDPSESDSLINHNLAAYRHLEKLKDNTNDVSKLVAKLQTYKNITGKVPEGIKNL